MNQSGTLRATYNYDANGNRSDLTYANGNTTVYAYNLANWLTGLTNKNGVTVLSSYSYAYYADGNQRTKTDNASRITTYTYDGAGRLKTEAESTGYGAAYQYNAFGNRTTMTVTGAESYTTTYDYDANNRLRTESKAVSTSTLVTNYYYDPNGNQLSKVSEALVAAGSGTPSLSLGKTGAELYKYDGFNRLTEANIGGDIVRYDYRADGLRNSKTSNTGTVTHLWDGGNIMADVPSAGTTEVYLRGVGLIMATGSSSAYYLYNGHGDVVQLTGTNGAVTKSYDYDAFGVERAPVSNDTNPWRYCGEYFDAETGTVYLRARYYSPGTGRFTAEDPLGSGLNWYVYSINNPILYHDPTGLISVVFTASNMKDQADVRAAFYTEKYETESFVISVKSTEGFVNEWNKFFKNNKNATIDAIEIISHGSITGDIGKDASGTAYSTCYLYFTEVATNRLYARNLDGMWAGDRAVSDLSAVSAKELNINGCNSANPDTYNVVYGFMQNGNFSTITGFDGGAQWDAGAINPGYNTRGDHIRGGGELVLQRSSPNWDPYYYIKKYQKTWWKYVDKVYEEGYMVPQRQREDRRTF